LRKTAVKAKPRKTKAGTRPADEVFELRQRLSPDPERPVSQQRFSHLLGVSWSTIARWEGGGTPDPLMRRKLARLGHLLDLMGGMVRPEDRMAFLEQHHPLLLNMRPVDLLDTDAGEKAVAGLLEGAATGSFA